MSYQRELNQRAAVSHPITDFAGINNLAIWLKQQVDGQKLSLPVYLLAHATDGVIWGRLDADGLVTSHDALHKAEPVGEWDTYRVETAQKSLPSLRTNTVQQLRLFNEQAELFIWRDGDGGWNGRWFKDVVADGRWSDCFDEPQLLWGTHGTHLPNGFTLLEDGAQGLYHAVPVKVALIEDKEANGKLKQSVALTIRHYLDDDEYGQVYTAVSRLVAIEGGN